MSTTQSKLMQAAIKCGAAALYPTSIEGLFFRPLGFGDIRWFREIKKKQEAAKDAAQDAQEFEDEFLDFVILDLTRDEDGAHACESREELDQVPPKVIIRLAEEAGEYIQGNALPAGTKRPPAGTKRQPAPAKRTRKRS